METEKEKIRLGVSSCLLGQNVRYDGGHKQDRYITDTLGEYFAWVPVCPEVEYGLPIPREAMHLAGDPGAPHLVTRESGIDHTEGMLRWAAKKLAELEKAGLSGFIFKSRSPSSGLSGVKVYTPSGIKRGSGIFGGAFARRFPLVPAEDDGRLHNPALRENFLERVFVYSRWQEYLRKGGSLRGLVAFHTAHKLLIMAHSPRYYKLLGQLVAQGKGYGPGELHARYAGLLMEGMRLLATARKSTNVLQHIMGYFKRELSGDEKQELLEVIDNYHRGLVPLIVPVTLLNHYVRKFDQPYLKGQHYLHPHPVELMLRNHV